MRQIATLLAIAVAVPLFGAGCGGSAAEEPSAATPETVAVDIKTFQFEPDPLEIEAGQTVEWTNSDATIHTVVGKGIETGELDQGDTHAHTFEQPGTYAYVCDRHSGPGMKAEVIVK